MPLQGRQHWSPPGGSASCGQPAAAPGHMPAALCAYATPAMLVACQQIDVAHCMPALGESAKGLLEPHMPLPHADMRGTYLPPVNLPSCHSILPILQESVPLSSNDMDADADQTYIWGTNLSGAPLWARQQLQLPTCGTCGACGRADDTLQWHAASTCSQPAWCPTRPAYSLP